MQENRISWKKKLFKNISNRWGMLRHIIGVKLTLFVFRKKMLKLKKYSKILPNLVILEFIPLNRW